jgi:HAMP domain-containing protein
MRIGNKLLMLLSTIVILSVLSTAIVLYFLTASIVDRMMSAHLESVSVLKTNQLKAFEQKQTEAIQEIAIDQDLIKYMNSFHAGGEATDISDEETEEDLISSAMNSTLAYTDFNEVSILTKEGIVDFSTDIFQKDKDMSGEMYFSEGRSKVYFSPFYYSRSLLEPAITVSAPIMDRDGRLLGVASASVNIIQISNVVTEAAGLGETGEAILFNKYHYVVTTLKKHNNTLFRETVYTKGLNDCVETKPLKPKEMVFKDYHDDEVIGHYIWIPEYECCLMVKIDTAEVHKDIGRMESIIILVATVILLCSLLIGYYFADRISGPLKNLEYAAKEMSRGNFVSIDIKSEDEIGSLGKTFQTMEKELYESKKKLDDHQRTLEADVEKRTIELNSRVDELEKFRRLTVGREIKMIEMKKRLAALEKKEEDHGNAKK